MSLYLDHNATVPPRPEVLEAMAEVGRSRWGNPQSVHAWGRRARAVVEDAREQVADLVGCEARQVTFTSGATEANNTVIKGRARFRGTGTVVVGATEHASVRQPARYLRQHGVAGIEIPADGEGRITPQALGRFLRASDPVAMVSIMWANNETGTVQPVAELAAVCADHGVPLHSDAVQAAGKLALDFLESGVSAISLSAHKIGGPQGVGALIRDSEALPLDPLLHGGGHERDRRAGTENVAGIAGFGRAAELARGERHSFTDHTRALRDRLEDRLAQGNLAIEVVSTGAERLPNTSCLLIPGVEAETLLMNLDLEGIAVSSGSACASGGLRPSAVLQAMGYSDERARSELRVSLGPDNTAEDVDRFVQCLTDTVERLMRRGAKAGP
ncbi:cysteine desulfurase family protein [Thiohalorhabdus sp.]|uniref:cysteine desulfurase family protein n=1 Tax=Thiohalorhabdus sp. TaxID=3094134 RepID=UPI002FC3558B